MENTEQKSKLHKFSLVSLLCSLISIPFVLFGIIYLWSGIISLLLLIVSVILSIIYLKKIKEKERFRWVAIIAIALSIVTFFFLVIFDQERRNDVTLSVDDAKESQDVEIKELKNRLAELENKSNEVLKKPTVVSGQASVDRSMEYKKALMSQIVDGITRAQYISKLSDGINEIINNRIKDVNSIISKSESYSDTIDWDELDDYIANENAIWENQNKYSLLEINILNAMKLQAQAWLDVLGKKATKLSQTDSMSNSEYLKQKEELAIFVRNIYEVSLEQEKRVNDFQILINNWMDEARERNDELGEAIDYYSKSLELSRYNFTPVTTNYPVPIIPPQIRTTNCTINVSPVISNANIYCTTY